MSSPTPAPTGVALTTSSPRPTMHQHTCHVSHVTCHAARVTCHVLAAWPVLRLLSTCYGGRCEQRPGAGNLHPPGLVTRCQDAPLSSVHSVQCPQCPPCPVSTLSTHCGLLLLPEMSNSVSTPDSGLSSVHLSTHTHPGHGTHSNVTLGPASEPLYFPWSEPLLFFKLV